MLAYILIPLAVIGVMAVGGLVNAQGMAWYATLQKPAITPPPYVFQYAWSIIAVCVAISMLIVYHKAPASVYKKFIALLFIVNALLNIAWTVLFFGQHFMALAFIDALALAANTALLVVAVWPISYSASLLLMPYLVWLCFALVLNWQFMHLN